MPPLCPEFTDPVGRLRVIFFRSRSFSYHLELSTTCPERIRRVNCLFDFSPFNFKLSTFNPFSFSPSTFFATLTEGQAYLRNEDYKSVTDVFGRIMAIDANSAEAHAMMGTAYDKMFQESKAVEEYQAAEKANPDFPGVHSGLGQVYWRQHNVEGAKAELQEELKRFPTDPVSNCLLGEIALEESKFDEARALFVAAVQVNPQYKEALFGLGKTENKMGEAANAIEPLRKAIKIDPDYLEAHYHLGNALVTLGKTEEGKKERAIAAAIQAKQREQYAKKLSEK